MIVPKKIIYIVSSINKSLAFEWTVKFLDRKKYNLIFILLNPASSVLEDFLVDNNVIVYRLKFTGKKDMLSCFFNIYKILKKESADIVHAHLLDASLIGLSAAYFAGIKMRIYTRHNSTLHHLFFPRAIWYDKFINAFSTDIVSISNVVTDVLVRLENVNPTKIHLTNHGFVFEFPEDITAERKMALSEKYHLNYTQRPVIGVISRFMEWKGIQYTLSAFQEILKKYPKAILLLANAQGPYEKVLQTQLDALSPDSFRKIPFEEDVFGLYSLMDVFVHVPIDTAIEAFGQIYVEALAMEVPSVFTLSGIAHEFIKDNVNALVVDYKNSIQIQHAVERLLENDELRNLLAKQGREDVKDRFRLDHMITSLEMLYDKKD